MDRTGYELPEDLKAFTAGEPDSFQIIPGDLAVLLVVAWAIGVLMFWPYIG